MSTMSLEEHFRVRAVVHACSFHSHARYSAVVDLIWGNLDLLSIKVCCVVAEQAPDTRRGLAGSPDFGHSILEAMDGETRAVLMRNHGLILFGADLNEATLISEIIGAAAKVDINALAAIGDASQRVMPAELIPAMRARHLTSYGQPK